MGDWFPAAEWRRFGVVVVFDVVADGVVRFGSCFESAAVHELLLESREKALSDGVVVAVPGGAHAAGSAVPGEQQAVLAARVLGPAIGVMDRPLGGLRVVRARCSAETA